MYCALKLNREAQEKNEHTKKGTERGPCETLRSIGLLGGGKGSLFPLNDSLFTSAAALMREY